MIDTFLWWVGATVCAAGGLALTGAAVYCGFNLFFKGFCRAAVFLQVVDEAVKQGKTFWGCKWLD